MAFKDLSQLNENILTSSALTGDIELRSPAGISLYPDSDNSGDDKIVWLRDGARLVFEGPIADPREIKIQAPEPTSITEDSILTLPSTTGTFALLSDITDSESALTAYIDAGDEATLISANTYTDDRETAITIAYQTYTDTAESDAVATSNAYTDGRETAITSAYQTYTDTAESDAITASNAYTDTRETAITSAYETYADTAESDAITASNAYTDAAVSSGTGSLTTDDIPEASNLYYTDLRVQTYLTDNNYTTEAYVDQAEADAITASNAYTDTAESDAITASNAYTDTRETAITSAYQTYTDTAELDAVATSNSYTDGRETAITSAYQAYADTAEADANTYTDTRETAITSAYQAYADTAEADAIATASADATTKANSAEADAIVTSNTYTDTREAAITSAYQTYTDTAESDAVATANSYTDTQVTKTVIDSLGIQASSVDANSVALGTDTTGNYVAGVSGTLNEIEVSGSGSETASVTVGLPSNVSVTNDLTVGGDLFVTGTTVSIGAANLSVDDSFIYLNQGDAIGADNTTFTGTGLDDASFEGYFEGTTTTTYYARIDGTGATDTFEWSKDNFTTTEATGIAITGSEQDLDNNIKFHASATTGHTLGDVWSGTAAPLAVDTGIFSNVNTGTSAPGYTHIGVFYDASATRWKVFSEYDPEPNGDINTGDASFVLGAMEADCFIAREVDLTQAPTGNSHATTKLYVDNADIAVANAATAANASLQSTLQANIDTKLNATANAVSASKWNTARTITLGGDASGNVSIDGSQNVTLSVTVSDDSHNHVITNVDGLQTALDNKVDDSQVLTDVPSGAVFTDTVYTHPTSHPISFITGLQTALNAKVDDTQVLTDVPSGAVFTDTVYTHPTSHPISFITGLQTALNNKVDDSQVLTNVPSGALFTDTVYTHPTSHPISFITGLQTALDDKVDDSQVLTNVPAGAVFTDTNTQRAIHDTPVNGATTTSISSNWAFDNVKTAVPTGAVFTDTNTNNYTSGATFSTSDGVLTLEREGLTSLTVDLDGRFTDNVYADNMNQNVRTTDSPSFNTIRATSTTDASATSTGHGFQVGATDGQNIIMDSNEIIARDNGSLTTLYLQTDGQNTIFGNNTTDKVQIGDGAIVATGDITAYGTVSDRRQKENIERLENALDKVNQLNGYTFNYLNHEDRMTGVMAQEVQAVLPEAVFETNKLETEDGADPTLAVRHGNMVGLLIEAIKEQNLQIEELRQEIDKLNGKI